MSGLLDEMKMLLKKEGLLQKDLYFADYETFEEIPLFSRTAHIDFLQDFTFDEENTILINQAIGLADNAHKTAIGSLANDADDYFVCVSITGWKDIKELNCLTPNLYISRRRAWLLSCLNLEQHHTAQEVLINRYLLASGLEEYMAYSSKSAGGDPVRIYIVNQRYFQLHS
ncbi:Imm15 family immunity protein [Budvicia diplopodorum]|uniref:Imm15 family immunity protein n=1 Tax=Budvicia diplopodorum TaxID=1119056 RepID=UPI001359F656|nr:Imm15 family immunity protein [Budvicia diplopodorum]